MEKECFGEKLRRFIHPLVIKDLSVRRKFRLEVSGSIPENQQFIFVANHYTKSLKNRYDLLKEKVEAADRRE